MVKLVKVRKVDAAIRLSERFIVQLQPERPLCGLVPTAP